MLEVLIALQRWCDIHDFPLPKVTFEWPEDRVFAVEWEIYKSVEGFQQFLGFKRITRLVGFDINIIPIAPVANEDYGDELSG